MKSKTGAFRRYLALLLCMAAAVCLSGCSNVSDMVSGVAASGEFPVEINGVTISSRPQKAVVLSPNLADVILALGDETQLIAGVESCTQGSLKDLKKIPENDPQAIIDQNPDLVIAESFDASTASALSNANITTLSISPATDREDFERLYSQVSSAFSGGGAGYDAGVKCAQDIFITLDNINRIVPRDKILTVCYLYDLESSAVTGDMFASTLMSCAGVTNAFNSLSGGQYEFEALRISNPNVIFCAPGVKDQLLQDSRFSNFQAVKNNAIVELEPSYMEWQGRTVVQTAYEICGAAFPELLAESSETPEYSVDVTSAFPSSSEDTTSYSDLSQGDSSEEILRMQERLDELGYLDTEYDGHYGEYTAGCVREFQKANGLEETGIADAETQRVLFSKNAKPKESGENP